MIGLVVDTETTGLTYQDELIELGMVLFSFDDETGGVIDVVATYSGQRQPNVRINPEAEKVHGLSAMDLNGKHLDSPTIHDMLKRADKIYAHNARFDYRFITSIYPEFASKPWLCTMHDINWYEAGANSVKLDELSKLFGLKRANYHRALDDAFSTLELLCKVSPSGRTFLVELNQQPSREYQNQNSFRKTVPVTDERLALESMKSLIQGLIADKVLNDAEIHHLRDWLSQNRNFVLSWPASEIHNQIAEILADGVITEEERISLHKSLAALVGKDIEAKSPRQSKPIALPVNDAVTIQFDKRSFCLTGDFFYGPRERCIEAIQERGGKVLTNITKKLDFLVIGEIASPDWKFGNFGTKIMKAVEYRDKGINIAIVSESRWSECL
jgi:DNA polymerase III epsilon subunit-like protein